MITIQEKKNCCGCHACANVCPKKCITMEADEEGFLYPKIDKSKCINCGLCEKICPILHKAKLRAELPKAYAAFNKDEKTRLASSSGGVFSLLADYVLSQNGVVFGAAFNDKFEVEHIAIEKKEEIERLRVSKYVQSKISNTYTKAKQFLDEGRTVLFTGTPCQIGGLCSFLGKTYENLYTQDIICHGVPSPAVWEKYVQYREKIADAKTQSISFRDKCKGWKNFSMEFSFNNGDRYCQNLRKDPMMKMFLHNKCLRPSCYDCAFKTKSRQSDITLADFWGIGMVAPSMDDNKGTSLVLVQSQKGEKLFEAIKNNLSFKQVDLDRALKGNRSMTHSVKSSKREKMMKDFRDLPFEKVVKKHGSGLF